MKRCYSFLLMIYLISGAGLPLFAVYFGLIGFFVKFGAKLQLLNLLIKIQLYY